MSYETTLVPAYGRDYQSADSVYWDWNAGKDFLIADMSNRWNGKPASKENFPEGSSVRIRYNGLRDVVVIGPDYKPNKPATFKRRKPQAVKPKPVRPAKPAMMLPRRAMIRLLSWACGVAKRAPEFESDYSHNTLRLRYVPRADSYTADLYVESTDSASLIQGRHTFMVAESGFSTSYDVMITAHAARGMLRQLRKLESAFCEVYLKGPDIWIDATRYALATGRTMPSVRMVGEILGQSAEFIVGTSPAGLQACEMPKEYDKDRLSAVVATLPKDLELSVYVDVSQRATMLWFAGLDTPTQYRAAIMSILR